MKIKPFLRWAGGKQNLVEYILENTPEHSRINRYFEPFVGAGSLFFANGFSNAKISDANFQLINAYSFIKSDYLKVFNLFQNYNNKFVNKSEYYYEVRRLFNKDKDKNTYIQAARFIFLIHSNYNGMYRVNKRGDYNVPVGKLKPTLPTLSQLELINKKIERVTIKCADYKEILNEVEENDFVYLDPPYPPLDWSSPQNQYTVSNFSKNDHEDLMLFANKLRDMGCFVLISYPDMEFVKKLYADWEIVKLNTFRSISCKKERKKISELLIKNY